MRRALSALLGAALLVTRLGGSGDAAAARHAYVVVVANNASLTPGVSPLRYADDDGARWYELLAPTATQISLFTVLDAESQRVFRDEAAHAEAPTRANVLERLATYNRAMAADRARGDEAVLYFVLVGHGEVAPDGEGFVSLIDTPLTRADLFREVVAPSQASFNHLIVDACNAYLLVARRGPDERGPSAAAAIRGYVADEDLSRYPTTGVIVSTSRAQATHEWSVYGGGIFSQELRSALAGAADVNGDGRIEYSEVRAYVAAANLRIDDPRARLDVFVHAPALDRARPIADLREAHYRSWLRLPSEMQGRFHLEDDRGVRFADFHKTAERPLTLALAGARWYWLRDEEREVRVDLARPGAVEVTAAQLTPLRMAARGSIEQSFQRHLFEVPYGPAFYRGFVASTGDAPVDDRAPAFVPPSATGAPSVMPLERRLAAARARAATLGLRPGDDRYGDMLVSWAEKRLVAGDLAEADRAITSLERHVADVVIDRPLAEHKLAELRRRLAAAAPVDDRRRVAQASLDEATRLLGSGDNLGATRRANAGLDALDGKL